MSEPNAEQVIRAARKRKVAADGEPMLERPIQKVSLQGKIPVEVSEDDERVANLVRMGIGVVEARRLVAEVSW
jgi:type III secretion system FlhB-like substrate exporter